MIGPAGFMTAPQGRNSPTQEESIAALERQGWRFANWISAHDPARPEDQVAVMQKKPRPYTTQYREVNPDGTVI